MIALITGATKGIGKAITTAFAARGYEIIISSRSQKELELLKSELEHKFPGLVVRLFSADLSKKAEREKLINNIIENFSQLDLLINNAGVFLASDSIIKEEEEVLRYSMEVNLHAPYELSRGLISLLRKSNFAQIINICSVASIHAFSNGGSYSISKHAFLGFSRNLRAELMPEKIKVTSLLPGSTWSNSWAGADLPRERIMEPEDVARVVLCAIDLSPSAVMEEVVFGPMEGEL